MINREGEAKQKIKDAYRYLEESPTGLVRWVATWVSERGKAKQKCFSVNKYPDAHILACEYRDKMILELNKEGYEYAERHGN